MFGFIKYTAVPISLIAFMKISYCNFDYYTKFFALPDQPFLNTRINIAGLSVQDPNLYKIGKNYVIDKPCFLSKKSCPNGNYNSYSNHPQMYTEFGKVLTALESIPSEINNILFNSNECNNNCSYILNSDNYVSTNIRKYFKNISDSSRFYTGDLNSVIYNIDVLFGLNKNYNMNSNIIFDKYFVEWFVDKFNLFLNDFKVTSDQCSRVSPNHDSTLTNFLSLDFLNIIGFNFEYNCYCSSRKNYLNRSCSDKYSDKTDLIFRNLICSSIISNTVITFIDILFDECTAAYNNCKKANLKVFNNYDLYYITIIESLKKMKNLIQNNLNLKNNYVSSSLLLGGFATLPYTLTTNNVVTKGSTFVKINSNLINLEVLPKYI